jgi:hypothetical protein
MYAQVGDLLVIRGHRVGQADRAAEIMEVRGPEGTPPYLVRWLENEHVGLMFPGPDATIRPAERSDSRGNA